VPRQRWIPKNGVIQKIQGPAIQKNPVETKRQKRKGSQVKGTHAKGTGPKGSKKGGHLENLGKKGRGKRETNTINKASPTATGERTEGNAKVKRLKTAYTTECPKKRKGPHKNTGGEQPSGEARVVKQGRTARKKHVWDLHWKKERQMTRRTVKKHRRSTPTAPEKQERQELPTPTGDVPEQKNCGGGVYERKNKHRIYSKKMRGKNRKRLSKRGEGERFLQG